MGALQQRQTVQTGPEHLGERVRVVGERLHRGTEFGERGHQLRRSALAANARLVPRTNIASYMAG
jgi:hypothetical protein